MTTQLLNILPNEKEAANGGILCSPLGNELTTARLIDDMNPMRLSPTMQVAHGPSRETENPQSIVCYRQTKALDEEPTRVGENRPFGLPYNIEIVEYRRDPVCYL